MKRNRLNGDPIGGLVNYTNKLIGATTYYNNNGPARDDTCSYINMHSAAYMDYNDFMRMLDNRKIDMVELCSRCVFINIQSAFPKLIQTIRHEASDDTSAIFSIRNILEGVGKSVSCDMDFESEQPDEWVYDTLEDISESVCVKLDDWIKDKYPYENIEIEYNILSGTANNEFYGIEGLDSFIAITIQNGF